MLVSRFFAAERPTTPVAIEKMSIHIPEPSRLGRNACRTEYRVI